MNALTLQRCFNHAQREAVARCPECGRFFCRECITEHEDRVLCAACLRRLAAAPSAARPWLLNAARGLQMVLAVLVAWLFFYFVGQMLLSVPDSFHEGTLWQARWLDQP